MCETTTRPTAQQAQCQDYGEGIQKLENTVEFMDALSQGGLTEIASLAIMARTMMESMDGYSRINDIANALQTIHRIATETQHCINAEADKVACAYVDQSFLRRMAALRAAMEADVKQGENA